jgi:glycosyltransferase involved in cell wall biosynthesis
MKLLVFAHTPPPMHGQSVMVETLINGLRADPDIEILHVNVRLSQGLADVGRARAGKLAPLLLACLRAWRLRIRRGRCAFYYVPAPGARSPLWRDFIVMLLCRPFFSPVIFHWHAIGLGEWINNRATIIERWLAHALLGRAHLAIVLAPELSADASVFAPRRVAVVPNSVADPAPDTAPRLRPRDARLEVLFLGLCTRDKGVFDAMEGIALADRTEPGKFRLTVAGGFASAAEKREFDTRVAALPRGLVNYFGFADAEQKRALFRSADVFCFPTSYANEGQPLTLIEALAHDVPIITTRWRAIPGMLPREHVWFVNAGEPARIAQALAGVHHSPLPGGTLRRHYLLNFTPQQHLAAMRAALLAPRPEIQPREI